MYLGQATGERFRVTAGPGRPARCPTGTQTEDTGRFPSGATYANCYRPPVFAPAPPAAAGPVITVAAPVTRVSPVIQAAISPQISPILAQQQASPGAAITGQPIQQAAGPTATASEGMTDRQFREMLVMQEAAAERERAALERAYRAEQQAAERISEQQRLDYDRRLAEARTREQAEAVRREEERRRAEEEAARRAEEAAAEIPPIGPSAPAPPPMMPSITVPVAVSTLPTPVMEMGPPPPTEEKAAVPYLLLAAAAVGAAFLLKPKTRAKKR